jgi:hypothetical protein
MRYRFAVVGLLGALSVATTSCDGCNCGGNGGPGGGSGTITVINVMDSTARACEVLFATSSEPGPTVDFGDGVRGSVQRKDKKLALAFTVTSDVGLHSPITLTWPVKMRPEPSHPACYDRNGRMLPGHPLEIR